MSPGRCESGRLCFICGPLAPTGTSHTAGGCSVCLSGAPEYSEEHWLISDPRCSGGYMSAGIITVSTLSLSSVSLPLCLKSVRLRGVHARVTQATNFTDSA